MSAHSQVSDMSSNDRHSQNDGRQTQAFLSFWIRLVDRSILLRNILQADNVRRRLVARNEAFPVTRKFCMTVPLALQSIFLPLVRDGKTSL